MRPTVDAPELLRAQRRTALATIAIPTLAVPAAAWLAVETGLRAGEIAIWAFMHLATMCGITVGYHRGLAHGSFRAPPAVRAGLAVLGSMAAQGPPAHWVANHRRHHDLSDRPGDVHSPHAYAGRPFGRLRGFAHAHVGWLLTSHPANPGHYARDLLRDPVLRRVGGLYPVLVLAGLAAPAALLGVFTGSLRGAAGGLLFGGLVRIFTVHHATWAVNSVTHLWGRRRYRTSEHSVDNAWLAIPSAGESWHNGHHAFPASARFSYEWWRVDLGWLAIRGLQGLGLIEQVHVPAVEARRRAATG